MHISNDVTKSGFVWLPKFSRGFESFFNKGLTDAAVGAGNQECLLRDLHSVLPSVGQLIELP
jgi:hypothetical protein